MRRFVRFILIIGLLTCEALAAQGVSVLATEVVSRDVKQLIEALGTTRSFESTIITANLIEKVSQIHFQEGETVRQGDLLVTLSDSEELSKLKIAKADLKLAEKDFKRAQELLEKKAISESEFQDSEGALHKAQGSVAVIEAQLANHQITAPFDGVLGLRAVSVGALVQPGDKITTIDDVSKIRVDFDIPARYLSQIGVGDSIQGHVSAYSGKNFNGKVDVIDTQIDPQTRTLRIRGLFQNEKYLLKPGLLMVIEVDVGNKSMLLIPEESLVKSGQHNFVYKILKQGEKQIANRTPVKIGMRREGYIEITEGLAIGDLIVAHGVNKIRDGTQVRVASKISQQTKIIDVIKTVES